MSVPVRPKARAIALYLPQFHPIPENDEWWGTGFTEWTNVAKARPLFRGHVQPKLPADLGFYDLRVPEVREAQAALARAAGIEGFCYWHYWFGSGRRILERPFDEMLKTGKPDFKFCLAWANQSWSGIWHGNSGQILIEQKYPGQEDDAEHFQHLLPAFRDPRYIRVDNKPIFAVYDPGDHPHLKQFMSQWKEMAAEAGLAGIYFIAMWNKGPSERIADFDGISPFGPGDFIENRPTRLSARLQRYRAGDFGKISRFVPKQAIRPRRFRFRDVVETALDHGQVYGSRFIPTVLTGWDNTPRSAGRGVVFEGVDANLIEGYMRKAIAIVKDRPDQHRIVLIKAWNEWAEGNYLEPDVINGHAYLDAVNRSLSR